MLTVSWQETLEVFWSSSQWNVLVHWMQALWAKRKSSLTKGFGLWEWSEHMTQNLQSWDQMSSSTQWAWKSKQFRLLCLAQPVPQYLRPGVTRKNQKEDLTRGYQGDMWESRQRVRSPVPGEAGTSRRVWPNAEGNWGSRLAPIELLRGRSRTLMRIFSWLGDRQAWPEGIQERMKNMIRDIKNRYGFREA